MNDSATPDPQPDDEISPEEWRQRMEENPEFHAAIYASAKRVVLGEYGEVPEEMRQLAGEVVKKNETFNTITAVQKKMLALKEVLGCRGGSLSIDERVTQSRRLLDELVDLCLELPEPHRSQLLPGILATRASANRPPPDR